MEDRVSQLLDELVRLKAVELRQTFETQAELVLALAKAGLTNSRIAEIVGTTSATVRATRNQAKG